MTVYLNQLEREWLSKRVSGATAQTPLNQLKREYYISTLGSDFSKHGMWELETAWLTKYIIGKGGTPGSDLWKDVLLVIGQVPTHYENQNKILFYLHAGLNIASGSASLSPSASESASSSSSTSPSASESASPSLST